MPLLLLYTNILKAVNNFSDILIEANRSNSEILLGDDIQHYLSRVNKTIPISVKDVIHLTQKYKLYDRQSIDAIRLSSKSSLKSLSKKYDIPLPQIEELHTLLKDLKSNIYLLG